MSDNLKLLILENKNGEIICPYCKDSMFSNDYGKWLRRKLESSNNIFTNVSYGLQFVCHNRCKRFIHEDTIKEILKRLKFGK